MNKLDITAWLTAFIRYAGLLSILGSIHPLGIRGTVANPESSTACEKLTNYMDSLYRDFFPSADGISEGGPNGDAPTLPSADVSELAGIDDNDDHFDAVAAVHAETLNEEGPRDDTDSEEIMLASSAENDEPPDQAQDFPQPTPHAETSMNNDHEHDIGHPIPRAVSHPDASFNTEAQQGQGMTTNGHDDEDIPESLLHPGSNSDMEIPRDNDNDHDHKHPFGHIMPDNPSRSTSDMKTSTNDHERGIDRNAQDRSHTGPSSNVDATATTPDYDNDNPSINDDQVHRGMDQDIHGTRTHFGPNSNIDTGLKDNDHEGHDHGHGSLSRVIPENPSGSTSDMKTSTNDHERGIDRNAQDRSRAGPSSNVDVTATTPDYDHDNPSINYDQVQGGMDQDIHGTRTHFEPSSNIDTGLKDNDHEDHHRGQGSLSHIIPETPSHSESSSDSESSTDGDHEFDFNHNFQDDAPHLGSNFGKGSSSNNDHNNDDNFQATLPNFEPSSEIESPGNDDQGYDLSNKMPVSASRPGSMFSFEAAKNSAPPNEHNHIPHIPSQSGSSSVLESSIDNGHDHNPKATAQPGLPSSRQASTSDTESREITDTSGEAGSVSIQHNGGSSNVKMSTSIASYSSPKPGTKQSANSDILIGKASKVNSLPSIVSIRKDGVHICAGVLIQTDDKLGTDIVVADAPCVKDAYDDASHFDVVIGVYFVDEKPPQRNIIGILSVGLNMDRNTKMLIIQFGVVKLKERVKFGRIAQPICLAIDTDDAPCGDKGIVAGWGNVELKGGDSDWKPDGHWPLNVASVTVHTTKDPCQRIYRKFRARDMFCTVGYSYSGEGSPYIIYQGGAATLHGIVIPPRKDTSTKVKGTIYARIAPHYKWIRAKISQLAKRRVKPS